MACFQRITFCGIVAILKIHYTQSTSDTTMIKFEIKIQTVYCNE